MEDAQPSGTETTGYEATEVAPSRRLERARISKHAAGRQKPLPKKDKSRRRAREIIKNRQQAADLKALKEAANG